MLGLGIEQDSSGNLIAYMHNNKGTLISECTSGNFYYLLDGLSSVVGLMAGSGSLVNAYLYDPYGTSLNKNETVSNPWQYAGGYYDATTGLYKFGTRYYDPQTGRWTQKDPVGGSVRQFSGIQ